MQQISFTDAEFTSKKRKTRREKFLEEMEIAVPWVELESVIEPHYPKAGNGRQPYLLSTMLRVHVMQHWHNMSDPAMEDALYEIQSMRRFAGLTLSGPIPDEATILKFRRRLEKHKIGKQLFKKVARHLEKKGLLLKEGTTVDATIINAPSSTTKNKDKCRDPEMHQTKKGNQWYFGMKAHIGVDAKSGSIHSHETTPANDHDITQTGNLLHGEEKDAFGDSGYRGVEKREELKESKTQWHIAMMNSKRKKLGDSPLCQVLEKLEKLKASIRSKVEHPFRIIKRQFGFTKVRYKGMDKNDNHLQTMFALANLYMNRRSLV
jgi:transposase, IS5 family